MARRISACLGWAHIFREAANQGDFKSIAYGLTALILTIVALDQFVWRPLLAWSDRFKVEMVESDQPPTSWFYDLIYTSRLFQWAGSIFTKANENFDHWMIRRAPMQEEWKDNGSKLNWNLIALYLLTALLILYGGYRSLAMLTSVPQAQWGRSEWASLQPSCA